MTPPLIALVILAWIVATAGTLAFAFRREIASAWNEPVLTAPVLVIESDDWGFGPLEQAERLRELAVLLAKHRDCTGRAPVITLGMVLAGPDTARIAAEDCRSYHRLMLTDAPLDAVREAIACGVRAGVFALQLHGMEHFWPPVLLQAAKHDAAVRNWLAGAELPLTETLPAHLQSRWIDGSRLPSAMLPAEDVAGAAQNEVKAFEAAFGTIPDVVVPPTFIWNTTAERAWRAAGARVLVTPGCHYERRGPDGRPARIKSDIYNAKTGSSGLMYLVRDDYFEPSFGHRALRGLGALRVKSRLGRPTLLETHRANFIGDAATVSLAELDRLLESALATFPDLRFMSSAELARHYRERTPLVERRLLPRLHCFMLRLRDISRLRKLAWASGLAFPAALLYAVTRHSRLPRSARI